MLEKVVEQNIERNIQIGKREIEMIKEQNEQIDKEKENLGSLLAMQ